MSTNAPGAPNTMSKPARSTRRPSFSAAHPWANSCTYSDASVAAVTMPSWPLVRSGTRGWGMVHHFQKPRTENVASTTSALRRTMSLPTASYEVRMVRAKPGTTTCRYNNVRLTTRSRPASVRDAIRWVVGANIRSSTPPAIISAPDNNSTACCTRYRPMVPNSFE